MSSVLAQTTPLFTAVLARCLFKDQISAWRWGCIVVGLLGVAIVVGGATVVLVSVLALNLERRRVLNAPPLRM